MSAKYLFVVGGVYSGCGKGLGAAAIAKLLLMRGVKVNLIKCDPYYNTNAGTMNPRQHGEVFLCDDGSETDLDLGHYERLTGINMSHKNIFTNGTLSDEIREAEKRGDYLGQTVQVVPHVTGLIKRKFIEAAEGFDVLIAEIGGTVGDDESAAMYEAIASFKYKNPDDVMIAMVAPICPNNTVKELKTKPLQNAVRALRSTGLQCDMLLCRCDQPVPDELLDKIAELTYVSRKAVFFAPDVTNIYQVPIEFYDRNVDDLIVDRFRVKRDGINLKKYRNLVEKYGDGKHLPTVEIGIVGKYENHDEAYISLKEALTHSAVANNVKLKIKWLDAEELEFSKEKMLENLQGIVVPGGFDIRGVEGKIRAITFCRENNIPFLGICLGLQCAVIEFARNVLGLEGATSQEFETNTKIPVVHFVAGQSADIKKSGTMRLGAYECELEKDTVVRELYKKKLITERHRHRLEVNNEFLDRYAERGFLVSGKNPQSNLVEMMELKRELHPFFVGTQAHPEFKSRLGESAPLFDGLVKAAVKMIDNNNGQV